MGISRQKDPLPHHPLVKGSQCWSSLSPQPLFLLARGVYQLMTGSSVKLELRLCPTKPGSIPKISPICWTSNEELYNLRAFHLDCTSNHRLLDQMHRAVPLVKTLIGVYFWHSLIIEGYSQGCSRGYCKISEQGYCLGQHG